MSDELSLIGSIIDMPLETFEEELVKQKVNIGTINNLILNLEAMYNELKVRKDKVAEIIYRGEKPKGDPETMKVITGLYAEMIKAEQKITYLKQRSSELIDVG